MEASARLQAAIGRVLGWWIQPPMRVRWETSASEFVRGRAEAVEISLRDVATSRLAIDRLQIRAEGVQVLPGLPARLQVARLRVTAIVEQASVDRWLRSESLPFRLELTDSGVGARTELGGVPLSVIEAGISVNQGWLMLQPHRGSFLGMPNYFAPLFRSALPLPRLPGGWRLDDVRHRQGQISLHFELEGFEERLGPGWTQRLRRRLTGDGSV